MQKAYVYLKDIIDRLTPSSPVTESMTIPRTMLNDMVDMLEVIFAAMRKGKSGYILYLHGEMYFGSASRTEEEAWGFAIKKLRKKAVASVSREKVIEELKAEGFTCERIGIYLFE